MTNVPRTMALTALLFCTLATGAAAEPSTDFTLLLAGEDCIDLLALDGLLYGATASGGIMIWNPDDLDDPARWTSLDGLTSNRVTDLTWTDRHFWAATDGGGLTRIDVDDGAPSFRQFARAGALNLTSVVGSVVGADELVYYGLADGGVGVIRGDLPGNIFDAGTHPGLVDDRILDLALDDDDLWVATEDGISLYRSGIFTDRSAGLTDRRVAELLSRDGTVWGATGDGVFVWSEAGGTWSRVGDLDASIVSLAHLNGDLWALTEGTGTAARLQRWDGVAWSAEDAPSGRVATLAADDRLWVGGRQRQVAENGDAKAPLIAARDGADDWRLWVDDGLFFSAIDGVEIDRDGTAWVGSRHAAGWAGWDGESWTQIVETASVDNDSIGLINYNSPILSMDSAADGSLWITQFQGGGVIRHRPELPDCDFIRRNETELTDNRNVRLLVHPDGPVLCMSDINGVDVLVDPDRWYDAAAWLHLPDDASGTSGVVVRDAAIARRDQIWFTSDDGGLVLWDTNGTSAGADDPLTIGDPSDDVWTPAVTEVLGSSYSFTSSKGLDVDSSGMLWCAGGGGVVRMRLKNYNDNLLDLEVLKMWRERVDPDLPGLLQGSVRDIVIDANDDAWVCHEAGLDRIRVRGEFSDVDPFTNAGAFEVFGLELAGSSSIVGVIEGVVRELDVSDDRRTVIAGGAGGAMLVRVGSDQSSTATPLVALSIYPNPFRPGDHPEGLKLAGYESEATQGSLAIDGGAWVEIYDLEGKLVHRNRNVEQETSFWDGRNLRGTIVAAGTYLVRVELDGFVEVRPLAVLP